MVPDEAVFSRHRRRRRRPPHPPQRPCPTKNRSGTGAKGLGQTWPTKKPTEKSCSRRTNSVPAATDGSRTRTRGQFWPRRRRGKPSTVGGTRRRPRGGRRAAAGARETNRGGLCARHGALGPTCACNRGTETHVRKEDRREEAIARRANTHAHTSFSTLSRNERLKKKSRIGRRRSSFMVSSCTAQAGAVGAGRYRGVKAMVMRERASGTSGEGQCRVGLGASEAPDERRSDRGSDRDR